EAQHASSSDLMTVSDSEVRSNACVSGLPRANPSRVNVVGKSGVTSSFCSREPRSADSSSTEIANQHASGHSAAVPSVESGLQGTTIRAGRLGGPRPKGRARMKKRLLQRFQNICHENNADVDATELDVLRALTPAASCEVLERWVSLIEKGVQRHPPYGLFVREQGRKAAASAARAINRGSWFTERGRMCQSSLT
ncbi:hypothetical protein FOL47_002052, partial [Perkinsus chesapeaki]